MIQLGGDERAGGEKLEMALAYAQEAAENGLYLSCVQAVRHAVEAATEVGLHRQDATFAKLAAGLDVARVALTKMTSAGFKLYSREVALQFRDMRDRVAVLMTAATMH